jgi:2-polyprenyl-3-methyl-5-hydroxy-6-metoxy-1,4-benzoquinol methylase
MGHKRDSHRNVVSELGVTGERPSAQEPDLYSGYEVWKGWSETFAFDEEDDDYFAGETRGARIANGDLLEIGFGSGRFLAWAKSKAARISGTEINEGLLEAARRFGVAILPADFECVAQEYRERFDTIIAFDVFEHFTIAETVVRLSAIEMMLRPGGHLFLRFPNGQSPFGLISQAADPTHKAALSKRAIMRLAQGTRLEVVRYAGSYRIGARSLTKWFARRLRGGVRRLIDLSLNWIYSVQIPWDPVVVLVLRKR